MLFRYAVYVNEQGGEQIVHPPVCTRLRSISTIKTKNLRTPNEYAGHERGCVDSSPLTVCFGLSWMQIKKDGVGKTDPIGREHYPTVINEPWLYFLISHSLKDLSVKLTPSSSNQIIPKYFNASRIAFSFSGGHWGTLEFLDLGRL